MYLGQVLNEFRQTMTSSSRQLGPRHGLSRPRHINLTHDSKSKSKSTFQKDVKVFQYMGTDAPSTFNKSEDMIVLTGLLPPIHTYALESDIRHEIGETIRNGTNKNLSTCGDKDFEFLRVCGRKVSVVSVKPGFVWNGASIKAAAGQGAVYVRLIKDFNSTVLSSDEELPDVKFLRQEDSMITSGAHNVDPSESAECPTTSTASPQSSHIQQRCNVRSPIITRLAASRAKQTSTLESGRASASPAASPVRQNFTHTTHRAPSPNGLSQMQCDSESSCSLENEQIQSRNRLRSSFQIERGSSSSRTRTLDVTGDLQSMFPKFSAEAIAFVHKLTGENVSESCDILLSGPSAASIIKYLRKQIDDGRSVDLIVNPNNVWNSAIMYYKNSNVSLRSQINVIYQGSPAIDLGGLRRQFYTTLLKHFAENKHVVLFDGSEFNLRPVSYPSATISGLYTVLGNILIHSILFEEIGFPYLAPFVYWYIASGESKAVEHISNSDLSSDVLSAVLKVLYTYLFILLALNVLH